MPPQPPQQAYAQPNHAAKVLGAIEADSNGDLYAQRQMIEQQINLLKSQMNSN